MFDFFKKKDENTSRQENNQSPDLNTQNEPEEQKGFFKLSLDKLRETILNTKQTLIGNVSEIVENKETVDDFLLDDIEELLIKADIGVQTSCDLVDKMRKIKNSLKPNDIKEFIKKEFDEIMQGCPSTDLNLKPGLNIFFITGVNGAGKTTLIAKLAYMYKQEGKKVLVAAGDTYRAAAEEQLNIWADRAGADIVRKDGVDSAAVVYDAIKKAQNENYDILLIDTAGRLHNKHNLMEELKKVLNVINKLAPNDFTESLLVLDATTGQNGLKQADIFAKTANLTGIALTKIDGSAKGGVIISIAKEYKLPVKLIGVGEKMTDLKLFNSGDFIEALF